MLVEGAGIHSYDVFGAPALPLTDWEALMEIEGHTGRSLGPGQ